VFSSDLSSRMPEDGAPDPVFFDNLGRVLQNLNEDRSNGVGE
jgi:hypothetical protein